MFLDVNSRQPRENKKKYVIEVQDHQQAMRAANPIVDLEDSVRRGVSDPFSNPNFIINRINDDLFSSPLNLGLGNRELLAYHGNNYHSNRAFHPLQSLPSRRILSPHIGANVGMTNGFTPAGDVMQNAVKEEVVARHPSSFKLINPSISLLNSNNPLHPVNSANLVNEEVLHNQETIGKSLNFGLPGGVAGYVGRFGNSAGVIKGFVSSAKTNANNQLSDYVSLMDRRLPAIHRSLDSHIKKLQSPMLGEMNFRNLYKMKPQVVNSYALNNHNAGNHRLNYGKQFQNVNSARSNSRINPLTGLPEDLEERSYGLISSITSVSDSTAPLAKAVTSSSNEHDDANSNFELGTETSQRRVAEKSEGPESMEFHEAPSSIEKESPEEQPIDYNLASLKSFLEEDSILRSKLNKDGLESIDPKKDPSFDADMSIDGNQEKLPNLNAKRTFLSKNLNKKRKSRKRKTG